MKKSKKILALVLAAMMLAALVTGCGGTAGTTAPSASASTAPASAAPASTAPSAAPSSAAPAASSDNGEAALTKLLAMEDKLPLGGVIPSHLDSRASINKALPFQKDEDGITIGWCSASQGADFFTEMVKTAQDAAAKYGYKFEFQVANFDVNAQMTQIENYLTQNVDFLVVNAVDIDATAKYYQEAVDKGIPVIAVGPTGGKPEYPLICTVCESSFDAGYQVGLYAGEKLYDQYKDKALKIGFAIARAGDSDSNSKCSGFVSGYLFSHAKMAGKPYASKWDASLDGYNAWVACRDKGSFSIDGVIDLVGSVSAGSTDAGAFQPVTEDLLTAHPDMNMILSDCGTCQDGVLAAIAQHGLTAGKDILYVTGGEGEDYEMQRIKEGKIYAAASNPPLYTGAGVIDLIHKIVEEGYDANNLPATLYTPVYALTAENVDKYMVAGQKFSAADPWEVINIDQYNAKSGG
jgi:ribose transport system substrate-binding protein